MTSDRSNSQRKSDRAIEVLGIMRSPDRKWYYETLIDSYKERIQNAINLLSLSNLTTLEFQEVGQNLSTMLGVVLETKMKVINIVDRLRNLS